ncbi:MAG TPA: sulfurtransferase [Candidatus Limnocylindrales bacterium]|nr:sulfurtransferase [Candidatus Limnocylindrales bacterium]
MSLISPDELLARLGDPALRICDVRWWLADPAKGRRDYTAAHLPGAVFIDVDTDLVAPEGPGRHPLPSPADFVARMAALGIDDADEVVAYDDAGGSIAARLWWMLDDLGHPSVRVLDGGLATWIAAGGALTDEVPVLPPATLTLRRAWSRVLDRVELAARLRAGDIALIDARADERYRGDVEPIDPVAGHIPGAISRPLTGSLGPDGRFLDPEVLRARFDGLGPEIATSCGSGVTACHLSLAMRVAGLPDPLLYPGSYSDWSTAGMPVATGDEPGTPV